MTSIICTLSVGGEAISLFDADDMEDAYIYLEELRFSGELMSVSRPCGHPVWDGKETVDMRFALPHEELEYYKARHDAVNSGGRFVCYLKLTGEPAEPVSCCESA